MKEHEFTNEEMSQFYKQIGQNVKELRAQKGVTQMQLANAMGHNSVGHIAKAELNKYDKHFSIQNLYMIAKVLEVDMCVLLKGC
jgi:transcriptional regulator with XRE-family HTH domain